MPSSYGRSSYKYLVAVVAVLVAAGLSFVAGLDLIDAIVLVLATGLVSLGLASEYLIAASIILLTSIPILQLFDSSASFLEDSASSHIATWSLLLVIIGSIGLLASDTTSRPEKKEPSPNPLSPKTETRYGPKPVEQPRRPYLATPTQGKPTTPRRRPRKPPRLIQ